MTPSQQRYHRKAQAKHRGGGTSHKTAKEDAQIMLAWEAGDLSEGQVAAALGLDRISLRKLRDDSIAAGLAMVEALTPPTKPGRPTSRDAWRHNECPGEN